MIRESYNSEEVDKLIMAVADVKSLSSMQEPRDSGFGSRHSSRTFKTQKTFKTSKSKNTRTSQTTKHSKESNTSYQSNLSNNTVKSKKSDLSREREVILEVLPHIREYNRAKLEKHLKENPMYNSSEQLVFYNEKGKEV